MKIFKSSLIIAAIFSFFLVLNFSACKKDILNSDPNARLSFSLDTVLFDTVFTKLGGTNNPRSVNKQFVVRNLTNGTLKSSIRLAGGTSSYYRINIDGVPTLSVDNYEIRPQDSIYIFVEVTIDPLNSNNPLIVEDSIIFNTNGNEQKVYLAAWGQDAHYFEDVVLDCNTEWLDKEKPYVIYQRVLVAENCKFTIGPGVKIYCTNNTSYRYDPPIFNNILVAGSLEINGTESEPVIIQGSRLGAAFENLPGQWNGIRLLSTSRNNIINHLIIKNADIGIQVDSLANMGPYKLRLNNTQILNMSLAGLVGYTASISAVNTIIANCGLFTFIGELGGTYDFRHCTFATYNFTFSRLDPHFYATNRDYVDGNGQRFNNILNLDIRNSIIDGHNKEEIKIENLGSGAINPLISNTLIKTNQNSLAINDNILSQNPRFKNPRNNNYELDTLSPAKDKGVILNPPVPTDIKGNLRDLNPDMGAWERVD